MESPLKNYTFCNIIQKGIYGNIWKIKSNIDNKFYALKIVKNHHDIANMEYNLMKIFSHKNILSCKEKRIINNDSFIVMELANTDLYELSKKNRLTNRKIVHYLNEILDGIEYIHSMGYVHGDLKLENILLKNGQIKICDFATLIYIKNKKLTNLEKSVGTIEMMSPEVKIGMITYASDIYSFGHIIKNLQYNLQFKNKNLKKISSKCLIYDYRKRPTISELRLLLKNEKN